MISNTYLYNNRTMLTWSIPPFNENQIIKRLISRNKYFSIYMFKDCCNKNFILSWISQSYVSHAWHLNINSMFEEKEDTSICQHLHFPIYTLYFPLQQTFSCEFPCSIILLTFTQFDRCSILHDTDPHLILVMKSGQR